LQRLGFWVRPVENPKRLAFTRRLIACLLLLPAAASSFAQAPNVLTWRYDNTHQGQNTQETILTPSNVNTNTFGKLFSRTVDGEVYAQPLYVGNLALPGLGTHNVIFIADEHDSVYAFDADSNGGSNSAPLWQASMLSTAHGAAAGATTVPTADVQSGTGDLNPEIGITSTPTIDLTNNTLFVVSKTKENGNYFQRLHALNILTGNEQPGSPVVISGSVPGTGSGSSGGTLAFSSLWQNNRVAMDLFNGNIYLGFGSHGDDGPWHGWVLVYNETTLQQTAEFCTSPNGYGDGVWGAGAAFPIDTVTTNGRAFLSTGNGDFTSYPPLNNSVDYGESILGFNLANGGFAISEAFTDFNQATLTSEDEDQGSGGVLMLPNQPGTYPHLLVQVGKEGRILVLNRDALGGYAPGGSYNTNAVQDINGALGGGLWSTPAYWNGNVYIWGENDVLKMFPITNGVLATQASAQASVSSTFPGATPVVSSDGTQNGIVWTLVTDLYNSNGSSILYAFNAQNVAQQLYASNQNSSRDDAGPAIKFTVPVITNGKVYVGSGYQIDVYGLLNAEQPAPAPAISPAGGTFSGSQQVTITDSVSGASIYYTVDGSTPTTGSTLYTGPFQLTTDTTVQAISSAAGYLQSSVSSATYTFNTQVPSPQFSPAAGSYTTTQSVTISDTTSGATIYYTTDGSTPTTGSAKYTAPITVSSSAVINAIAVDTGLTPSNVASATYSIQPNGTEINFGNGFAVATGLTLNGSATNTDDSRLQLTTGLTYQAGSVFYNTPTNIQSFTTDFAFQLSNAQADGFTFTIQNVAPTAIGGYGGSLGYGPNPYGGTTGGIANSVALKFDFFSNAGEGTDSTGVYTDGATPTVPAVDMTSSGVLLTSGDSMAAHVTYDGTNLVLTLTDIVVSKVFTHTFPINIPATIGSNVAYIGFTGGTGGETSSQKILSWTFTSQSGSVTQTPTFSPAAGSFTTAQQVALSDATAGAVIYYTTDGSVPTTSSTVYSSPISVDSGSVTINALAQASGMSASAVASAVYTIQPGVTATPIFSPGTGTYTAAQSVVISDSTPGAVIYYTTNGTAPTTASAVYSSAIAVSSSSTLEALAVAPGLTQSAVASAAYVIQTGGSSSINFASGFPSATGLQLNGASKVSSSNFLELTDGGDYEASSTFWTTPVNIQTFTTNFTFQLSSATADGFTFTIQNAGLTALGAYGGGLGYGADPNNGPTASIGKSVAVKFDIYSNSGEGNDSTGVFTNGATPTNPAVSLTSSGIVLSSGDTIAAQLTYNGTTLTLNLTDTVTNATFTQAFTVNIPSTVGANTAYVGFTGGTGGASAIQNIKTWTFTSSTTQIAADPVFSPLPGTYSTAQNVALSTATPGAIIYYTVDGSTPTHSSSVYSAPIVVSAASLTIRALASASGYQDSPIVMGAYVIQAAATATPTFSPGAGTYSVAQSVAISDTTPGAVIYYTTNGTAPTTSSAVYSSAITVSANTTVEALAVAPGFGQSVVASAAYVIQAGVTSTPTFSPAAGTYTSAQSVAISDSTPGAVIYYTTNGTTPTTASAVYSSAVTVSSSSTLEALAIAPGLTQSAVASAAYVIQAGVTATPTFAPAAGTYTSAQSVAISDSTPGAVIYYTTNGTAPTTASAVYSSAVTVSSSSTLEALAIAPGLTQSAVANAAYVIQTGGSASINFPSGFPSATGLQLNGKSKVSSSNFLELTDGGDYEASSAFWTTPVNIQTFTTNFTFQLSSATADGFTFTIQNAGLTALGAYGGGLGYGADPNNGPTASIGKSVAVKFDIYSNSGEGNDSTGVFTNGATPTNPAVSLTSSGIVLSSGDTIAAQLTYNGTTLTLNLTDTVTNATFTQAFTVNIPSNVGANTAYVGFTGGTGGASAIQNIKTWTFSSSTTPTAATPAFNPLPGTYTSTQNVALSTATPGATIYYTTNGTAPTTSSAVYSSAIAVSANTTLEAMAVAPGFAQSAAAIGAYVIQTAATAVPTFLPAAGTYSAAQSVAISDTTPGAVIYYTTNGTAPTTASAVYSTAIAVSANTTLEAIAVAPGFAQSAVSSAAYVIQAGVTAMPTFSPAAGTYSAAQSVVISDTTPGAVIYYTTNGIAPTTSSAVYSTAIAVSANTTLEALAIAPGFAQSAVASAAYVIQAGATAMPTFSPTAGTYTSAQSVAISDTTPGAVIYYTTNGTAPTIASAVYSTAIPVSTSSTLEALAVAPGSAQSAVASAAYVIQTSGSPSINFASGFPSATGLQLNGKSKVSSSNFLELTDGGDYEASSAFWTTPVNIQAFTTNFTFQLSSATADGFTFTIQDAGLTALGAYGGGLGYGPDPNNGPTGSIGKSIAIKFDIYSNSGEGTDSTGLFTDGATPTNPAVNLTSSGIVLSSGDTIAAQLTYNGTTLTLNLTDTVTNKTFTQAFTVNIPTTVGANTAYVGFTGGTGGASAIQNIKTWTFTPGTP
jgi:Chitobiase/beta-hexosaminidase C-terminal domain/Bacterial lectin